MDEKLKQELKAIFEGLNLDEASMDKIVQIFNENVSHKVNQEVEVALAEQDNIFSEQLRSFIEKLDVQQTAKMQQLVEALELNYIKKLKLLKEKYDNNYKSQFKKFKTDLLKTNNSFINMYLNKVVPQKMINEAVNHKRQERLIAEMRKLLSIDQAAGKEIIKEGIIEAKKTIDESNSKIESLIEENKKLQNHIDTFKRDILLEKKLSEVNPNKRKSLYNIYKDQTIEQINESFDYSSKLIDKQRKTYKENLKNSVINEKSNKGEFIKTMPKQDNIITESKNNLNNHTQMDDYISELTK